MVPNIRSFVFMEVRLCYKPRVQFVYSVGHCCLSEHCGPPVPFKIKSINCKIVFWVFLKYLMTFLDVYIFSLSYSKYVSYIDGHTSIS